jgi:hypothetical protein
MSTYFQFLMPYCCGQQSLIAVYYCVLDGVRITTFLELVPCHIFEKEHRFANWMRYHPQVKVWGGTYAVGSDSCSWTICLNYLYTHVGSYFVCSGLLFLFRSSLFLSQFLL